MTDAPDSPHRRAALNLWRAVDHEGEILDMLVQFWVSLR